MRNILFICYGNICRSPTAEFLFNYHVQQRHLSSVFHADSAAVGRDNIFSDGSGCGVYPPCALLLRERRGIDCSAKQARLLTAADYDRYEQLLVMDRQNYRAALRILGGDPLGKVRYLGDCIGGGEIEDPWYTLEFGKAFDEIERAVVSLLDSLK
ncbi:MAG: low molecular weight phosphotyrosine protein phosphatase [Clostridia bacterium]|nr:low molecular weight phosphotyrosine protein phosphatase [Clostridia bacterium]